jgi:hypothetical protein
MLRKILDLSKIIPGSISPRRRARPRGNCGICAGGGNRATPTPAHRQTPPKLLAGQVFGEDAVVEYSSNASKGGFVTCVVKVLPAIGAPYGTTKSVEYDAINTEPELNDFDVKEYEVNDGAAQLDWWSVPEDSTIPLVDTPLTS